MSFLWLCLSTPQQIPRRRLPRHRRRSTRLRLSSVSPPKKRCESSRPHVKRPKTAPAQIPVTVPETAPAQIPVAVPETTPAQIVVDPFTIFNTGGRTYAPIHDISTLVLHRDSRGFRYTVPAPRPPSPVRSDSDDDSPNVPKSPSQSDSDDDSPNCLPETKLHFPKGDPLELRPQTHPHV